MIKPLADRLVVKIIEAENKTSGGIILAGEQKSNLAEVLEVGSDIAEISKGDTVIINTYGGLITKHEGQALIVLRQCDVLAVVG